MYSNLEATLVEKERCIEDVTLVCLHGLVVRCPGFVHDLQNDPILAERAFQEAKRQQLIAIMANKQPQNEELKKKRKGLKAKQVEEVGPAPPVCQTPDVNQGEETPGQKNSNVNRKCSERVILIPVVHGLETLCWQEPS